MNAPLPNFSTAFRCIRDEVSAVLEQKSGRAVSTGSPLSQLVRIRPHTP